MVASFDTSSTWWSKFATSTVDAIFLLKFGNLFATTMKLPLLSPCTLVYVLLCLMCSGGNMVIVTNLTD